MVGGGGCDNIVVAWQVDGKQRSIAAQRRKKLRTYSYRVHKPGLWLRKTCCVEGTAPASTFFTLGDGIVYWVGP